MKFLIVIALVFFISVNAADKKKEETKKDGKKTFKRLIPADVLRGNNFKNHFDFFMCAKGNIFQLRNIKNISSEFKCVTFGQFTKQKFSRSIESIGHVIVSIKDDNKHLHLFRFKCL